MIYDLTHLMFDNMPSYPGDPAISIARQEDDKGIYRVSAINMGSHSGTHVDLPLHCIKDGDGVATVSIEKFFGEAVVISVPFPENKPIDLSAIDLSFVKPNDILLISSGWDELFGQDDFFTKNPGFADGTGEILKNLNIKAVGTDLPSVDVSENGAINHLELLSNDIIIFESLKGLCSLKGKRVMFYGVPLKIMMGDGSPIRAFAIE